MATGERYRLLLVGKTGNGKSSLGNTITGEENFRVVGGLSSGTRYCSMSQNKEFQVVDTPGVTDTHHRNEDILQEIAKFTASLSPGPHAILMVFKANSRFTDEEYNAYVELKKLLGNDMASHTIAVFTGGDVLKTENIDVRSEIENASPNFKTMMAEISNRYVIINNRETDEGEKKKQLSALVEKIQDLARDHAKSGMQENVSKLVKEAVDKKSAAKKIPKEQAREEYNREVMQHGTDEAGTRPMPVPYNFPKVVETVKNETHKKSVNINFCTLL